MAGHSAASVRSVTSKTTSFPMTFTEGSEHSPTEIARLAGLPISTAHRLTGELASRRPQAAATPGRTAPGRRYGRSAQRTPPPARTSL
jgi:hypothetical protein